MPTVRIDDETFAALKELAEPFVDSPNTVIRRLLIEKGLLEPKPSPVGKALKPPAKKVKVLTSDLTPQSLYERFLLRVLAEQFAGGGDKRTVTRSVIDRMVKHGFIGAADLELVATGETRAENTITWARNALKNRGLVARGSRRGQWELTEEGREAAGDLELPKKARAAGAV